MLIAARRWDDLLALALTEIRDYGARSTQVTRRLRALLEDLAGASAPSTARPCAAELAALDGAGAVRLPDPLRATVRGPAGPAGHRRPAAAAPLAGRFIPSGGCRCPAAGIGW